MLLSATAVAAGASISINANSAPYNTCPAMQGLGYQSDEAVIEAGMSQGVGMYRTTNGTSTAPIGTSVTVTWSDGSQSTGTIIAYSSDAAINPSTIKTSPPPKNGGGGGGGGGGGEGGSGGSSASNNSPPGPGDCVGAGCPPSNTGTVTVGRISKAQ